MTGYDGDLFFIIFSAGVHHLILTPPDRLQYTITSRKEMPNAEFTKEIASAAEDLYRLHTQETAKPRL